MDLIYYLYLPPMTPGTYHLVSLLISYLLLLLFIIIITTIIIDHLCLISADHI